MDSGEGCVLPFDASSLALDGKVAKAAGEKFAPAYQSAKPFNYICIDDFLPPAVLDRVLDDIAELPEPEHAFSRAQENLKASFIPERLPNYAKNLFYALNSRPFLQFLESISGIKGLIPDPYFAGGGIHRVGNGGHLDIHADFNLHQHLKLERRLNVLIYLNKDWQESYGGSFEVWEKDMSKKVAGFAPVFNRMCMFSTASDTFHGNPEPVNHPDGKPRLSIALYYYTATWSPSRKSHTTLFKPRPGTADEVDRFVARREKVEDLLPPMLYRRVARVLDRLGL